MKTIQPINVEEQLIKKYERIPTSVFDGPTEGSKWIADLIADLIREKASKGEMCVLGLATGSSPVGVYRELVNLHRVEKLSFKNVITFNLDEYYPMEATRIQSYVAFMHMHLFNHIDILPENIYIPDGNIPKEKIFEYCNWYEQEIEKAGGIDLQILGIGRTGHIGFNEPGSDIKSPTRLVSLDHLTIADAAKDFVSINNVPRRAITMGVGTIMKASQIILMAWGEGKAPIVKRAVEGPVTESVPSTFLQKHPNTIFVLDSASSGELTRFKTPWLVRDCKWDDRLIRQATIWLCQKMNKPILKLTNRDYNDNKLGDLVALYGPAYDINIKVFNDLQHTITGWPGGKPNADDTHRPERAIPYPKKVLIFSPHPDDDVICMGGTIERLVEQGHEVYIAYQTSGNVSVHDEDAIRYTEFLKSYKNNVGENARIDAWYDKVMKFIVNKSSGDRDIKEVQDIKKIIRETEVRAAARFINLPVDNLYFLDLPFYRTGTIDKKPLSQEDINILKNKLGEIKPDMIFAAGDMSDPHGTHRLCWNALLKAFKAFNHEVWFNKCSIWLYRGAWQEWDVSEADMAVPLSPDQVLKKRNAILKHQSQKDSPMFMDDDHREFWQRAEDRNKATAILYNELGMAEYEALEVFVKYKHIK
jgi:glucosamine-6-phosphate deaminase